MTIALIILAALLLPSLGLAVYLYERSSNRFSLQRKLDVIGKQLDKEFIKSANADMTRIEKIVRVNLKYKEQFDKMLKQFVQLQKSVERVEQIITDLSLNASSLNKIEIQTNLDLANDEISSISVIKNNVKSLIKTLTYQDDFLRTEFSQNKALIREVIEFYRNRRILLENISPQIDEYLLDVRDVSTKLSIKINEADPIASSKLLSQYTSMVEKFARIIDEGPAIQTHISKTIPAQTNNLLNLYKEKKQLLGEISHINFKASINKIALDFKIARKAFSVLDIEKAKKQLVKIITAVKFLERLINFEILSKAMVLKNYKGIIEETKKNLREYTHVRRSIRDISQSGKKLSVDFVSSYEDMVQEAKALDKVAIVYKNEIKKIDLSNSAKLQVTKKIINANRSLIEKMSEISSQIYILNIEKSIAINKYKRLEAAMNSIVANTKNKNVKLTIEETQEKKRIDEKMQAISTELNKDSIGQDTHDKLKQVGKLVSDYYNAIAGKIELSIIIINLFQEYASARAIKQELNESFTIAEREYLQGNYASSLNHILTTLEEVQNAR